LQGNFCILCAHQPRSLRQSADDRVPTSELG
jgi:large subunit ribosomal protein L28